MDNKVNTNVFLNTVDSHDTEGKASMDNINLLKVKADKANVIAHTVNGNKRVKKLKILQMNKGSADYDIKQDMLMFNVKEQNADIIFVSEANFKHSDPSKKANLDKSIKGFNLETSTQTNNDNCRCLMLISKKIPYERLLDEDNNNNPIVAIKTKTRKHESTVIIGHYRQWKMPGEESPNNKEGIKRQKNHLEELE